MGVTEDLLPKIIQGVLVVLDYEQSRAATESSVLKLRGGLLVKTSGAKPLVVGVGY